MEGTAGVELSKGGGQDPVQELSSTNPENVQSLTTEPKDQGRPGQALVSHQVPLQTALGHQKRDF